jgi:hypothetical protein
LLEPTTLISIELLPLQVLIFFSSSVEFNNTKIILKNKIILCGLPNQHFFIKIEKKDLYVRNTKDKGSNRYK